MRKQIEISQDSLIPSEPKFWKRSEHALADVKACLNLLKPRQSKNHYEVAWCKFVCGFDDFKKAFRSEGKQSFTTFHKWYEPIFTEIGVKDPLFEYLYKTRCAIEHSPTGAVGLKWTEIIEIANNNFCGGIKKIYFGSDGTYAFDFTKSHPSSPDPNMEYCYKAELDVVINYGESYYPKEHLGKPLDTKDPAEIGKLAVFYYENLFNEEKEKFGS